MAKEKRPVRYLTGKVEVHVTLSELRGAEAEKLKNRGPKQIGQLKDNQTIRIGKVKREEVQKRLEAATKILQTGKVPAAVKGGAPATKDATLAKAKGDLTKANNKLKEEQEKNKKLEAENKALKEQMDAHADPTSG